MNNKKKVPEVGLGYHFFDDGKVSNSRHYIAEILDVIPFDKAESIVIQTYLHLHHTCVPVIDDDKYSVKLIDIWEHEKEECDWIYADETDYFVRAKILDYDDDDIWFVRTKTGGWFSMDTTNCWQGGILDVDGEIFADNDSELNYTRRLPHDRK